MSTTILENSEDATSSARSCVIIRRDMRLVSSHARQKSSQLGDRYDLRDVISVSSEKCMVTTAVTTMIPQSMRRQYRHGAVGREVDCRGIETAKGQGKVTAGSLGRIEYDTQNSNSRDQLGAKHIGSPRRRSLMAFE
jgi:hypothetical protein